MTNLNTESEYPIYRFQVVNHTDDGNPESASTVQTADKQQQTGEAYKTTVGLKSEARAASQAIAQMHQRATELLNQLIERRQVSQKSATRKSYKHINAGSQSDGSSRVTQTNLCKTCKTV